MAFTEYDFLVFFLILIAAYWLFKRRAWQNALLLLASYVFYAWVHPWNALLIGFSTLFDYFLALGIAARREHARRFLTLSLALNVGVLAFFKYFNFFAEDISGTLFRLGLTPDETLIQIFLPLGLSFYTLKKIAYIIDVSRATMEPVRDPLAFALFVAFFPQLMIGPIDRAQNLVPQIQSDRAWRPEFFQRAWPLLLMGFFKKIVIADTIRSAVDRVFVLAEPAPLLTLAAALAFMIQLLADFSAYTDMSRGLAFLLGFDTPENFRAPFTAATPAQFWDRWHITLSTWLRDYLFFPLRRILLRARAPGWLSDTLPPILTMLISGIWHGAGWTYALWGGLFGVLIVIYQWLGMGGAWKPANRLQALLAWLVMISLLAFLFLIFRAPSLAWLAGALTSSPFAGSAQETVVALVTLSTGLVYGLPLLIKHEMDRRLPPTSILFDLYFTFAALGILLYVNSVAPDFIYAQF